MADSNTFKVRSIEELIEVFPEIFSENSSKYKLDNSYVNLDGSSLINFTFKKSDFNLDNSISYLGTLTQNELNKVLGIVFCSKNKNILGIFYQSKVPKNENDYVLALRQNNSILYRGGIIPGKGYQVEKEFDVNPNSDFDWPNLSNPLVKYPNHKPEIVSIIAGYNPNQ